jgi:hypothetical protein
MKTDKLKQGLEKRSSQNDLIENGFLPQHKMVSIYGIYIWKSFLFCFGKTCGTMLQRSWEFPPKCIKWLSLLQKFSKF